MVLIVLAGLFILTYGALGIIALRKPLLARLAAREALRRPGQSALLVGGLMIVGASILSGLVIADSAEASLTGTIGQEWGRVDLTVAAGGQFFAPGVANKLAADPTLTREMAGAQATVETVTSVANLDRRLASSAVRLVGFDPASQPAFGAYRLIDGRQTYGSDLPQTSVLLSRNLADSLRAQAGDRLQLIVARDGTTHPMEVTVGGISRAEGPGAYGLVPTIFASLDGARRLIGTDQINILRISAKGNGAAETAAAHRLAAPLRSAAARLGIGGPAAVREVKASDLAFVQSNSDGNRSFFLSLSFAVIVAAAALAVNLALALADERRPRLAVLRALGLTRSGLITTTLLEGALYSLAAAVLSTGPGILAGMFLVRRFRSGFIDVSALPASDIPVALSLKPGTLLGSIMAATLITVTTLLLAALRTSRMTIAPAIRDLPDKRAEAGWSWATRIALAGATLGAVPAVVLGNQAWRLLGGASLIIVGLTLARYLLSDRTRATLMGAALAVWALTLTTTSAPSDFNPILPVLVTVIGLSLLAVANLQLLEAAAARLWSRSGRMRATLRPPMAYLSRRPVRTGLAMGVFGIVLTAIVMLGVFIATQSAYAGAAVRMDMRVAAPGTHSVQLPPSVQSVVTSQASISTRIYTGPIQSTGTTSENSFVRLYEFSSGEFSAPPVALFGRDDHFKSDAAVWQAVRNDPTWVVSAVGNGSKTITFVSDHGQVTWKIAGQPLPGSLDGVIGSAAAFASFQSRPAETTLLVKLRPGADAKAVAREVAQATFPAAIDAASTRELLRAYMVAVRIWISTITLLIGMALVTGVLTIGILALRSVVERRHAIGVLRSIGYQRRQLVGGLVTEAMVTTSIGVLVGLGAGVVFGLRFLSLGYPNADYQLDWGSIGTTLALIYGTLVLVTIAPALRTARLAPAQALRLLD